MLIFRGVFFLISSLSAGLHKTWGCNWDWAFGSWRVPVVVQLGQVKWGHDKPRLMGVAIAIDPFQVVQAWKSAKSVLGDKCFLRSWEAKRSSGSLRCYLPPKRNDAWIKDLIIEWSMLVNGPMSGLGPGVPAIDSHENPPKKLVSNSLYPGGRFKMFCGFATTCGDDSIWGSYFFRWVDPTN